MDTVKISKRLDSAKKAQYEKAIQDFSKAIELDPNYGKAYMNRGIAYLKSGNNEMAAKDFLTSCRMGFNDGCMAPYL
jgi:Flp pilus assembly protein TadD